MKKTIIAVLLTVAMTVSTSCGTTSSSSDTDNTTADAEQAQESAEESAEIIPEEVAEYSADDILDMLDKNPLNASRTLKENVIYLTGTLSEIDANGEYIGIKGKEEYDIDTIKCYVSTDEQLDYIAGLSKNDGVRVLGKVTDVNGDAGYVIEIEEIEKYLLYPRFTIVNSNCDYSEYEKYAFEDGTTFWAPKKWKEYIDEEKSEGGYYFNFGNDDDFQSKGFPFYCSIGFSLYNDELLNSLAKEGLSLEDEESKFETMFYWETNFEEQLMQLDNDDSDGDSIESSYLFLNNNPAMSILIKSGSDEGFYKTIYMYMENKTVAIAAVYPANDQLDSEELFNIMLSVDQDIPNN